MADGSAQQGIPFFHPLGLILWPQAPVRAFTPPAIGQVGNSQRSAAGGENVDRAAQFTADIGVEGRVTNVGPRALVDPIHCFPTPGDQQYRVGPVDSDLRSPCARPGLTFTLL